MAGETPARWAVIEYGPDGTPVPCGYRGAARVLGSGHGYVLASYACGGYLASGFFDDTTGRGHGEPDGRGRWLRLVPDWDCEAYGPPGRPAGMLCYFSDPSTRTCGSHSECAASVDGARRLLFGMMQDKAAAGNEGAQRLAEQFTDPAQPLCWPVELGKPPYVAER